MNRGRGGRKAPSHVAPSNVQTLGVRGSQRSGLPASLQARPPGILRGAGSRQQTRSESPKLKDAVESVKIAFDFAIIKKLGDSSSEKPTAEEMGKVRHLFLKLKFLRIGRDDPKGEVLQNITTGLSYLAVKRPALLQTESVLIDAQSIFSGDGIPPSQRTPSSKFHQIGLLTVNLLWAAFKSVPRWPLELAKMYIEDAARNRDWVDHPLCFQFTENIKAHFKSLPIPDDQRTWSLENAPAGVLSEPAFDRFEEDQSQYIQQMIVEQFARRPAADPLTRSLVILGASTAGFYEVRKMIASRLEAMFNNPKLLKPGQEMFASLCVNATTSNEESIIHAILNVRHRQKPVHFFLCSFLLLTKANPNNFSLIIQRIVFAEFDAVKNTLGHMSIMNFFLTSGQELRERTAAELARQFNIITAQASSQNIPHVMRTLRNTIREISKISKINLGHFLKHFSRALLEECRPATADNRQATIDCLLDMANLCCYLRASGIRDQLLKGPISEEERADRLKFENDIADIQQQQIRWIQNTFVQVFSPTHEEMATAFDQIMFLGKKSCAVSLFEPNWPPETDRAMMSAAITSCDVREGTILRLTFIGRKFGNTYAMDLIWKIINRCCEKSSRLSGITDPAQLTESLLQLGWHDDPPIKIAGSSGKFASTEALWKWHLLALILSAFSPQEIGKHVWACYPQMRILITYCITGQVLLTQEERQIILYQRQREADAILVAEATNRGLETIPKDDSKYLADFCIINANENLRNVPQSLQDEITKLNKTIKLDSLLSENRDPDFLELLVKESTVDSTLDWIIDLVNQQPNDRFKMLPISVLTEYMILTRMPSQTAVKKSQLIASKKRIDEVFYHLEEQLKEDPEPLLDHIVKRLASESYTQRSCATQLVSQLYKDGTSSEALMDWTDGGNHQSGDLNITFILNRLLVLKNSKYARKNLINAIYVETNLQLIVGYLTLLEEFIQFDIENYEDVFDLAAALSHFLLHGLLTSTSYLQNQDIADNKTMVTFIIKVFNKITDWIFIISDNEKIAKKLRNWSCERNSDVITFTTQGRNICVPQNFLYSILVVLSLRFNNELALNWLNDFNTDFISEVKVDLPKWLIEFAAGSHCSEIVELAVRKMSKADVMMSARWHDFEGDHKATFLKIVDKKFQEDQAKPTSKNFPTLNYSISLLKRHLAISADKEGSELLKALQAIKISDNDGVSEFPQFRDANKGPKEEKMDSEVSLTNELKNYFETENVTSVRLHSLLKKISAAEDLSPAIATLMPLIGKNNSAVYTTHITGFGNIVRRIGMTLQKKNKLIDLEDFIPIMTRHLSEDRVASNPKLNTLRLIAMDFHRKIFTKTKPAAKPKEIPSTVEVKSLVTLINKEREKKSRVALQSLDTSPNEDQLIGHLSDILVDDYHRVFTTTNEADLKLFFNASSQQLQSIFLSTADWDVIHNAITFLLSERSSDVNHNSVLDFLWASERLRRLWKGREQSAERAKEHIIIMTVSQVQMYLHHFLGCEDESEMETRLPQLFHFLRGAKMKDKQFVDLRKHVESLKVGSEHLRSKLANLLYLFRPAGQEGTKIVGAESSACSVDKIVYRVILDLAAIGDSPVIGDKMSDAFLFCVSLTSTHPHLLLRHLNLMARLLKGRCHNELKEFRTQRHMDYFSNLATVMCHLAPHLMEDRYLPTFKDIIAECLEFLRVYPKIARRQSRPTSNHIFALLKRFLELDIVNGLKMLEEYTTLWHDLMAVYGTDTRDVQLYHAIFVMKIPQYQVPEQVLLTIQNENFRGLDPTERAHIEHNLASFPNSVIESIRTLAAALEDKGPKAVMPFEYGILDALTCILPDARAMAFDILLELVQHEPSKIKVYYQRMLNAMDQGPEILATERVMKFTVLAMTKSDEILKTVFHRGQKHDINVAKTIGRTISLLALLPAY